MTPRPWRLTRRQRVEMEAALLALRAGPHPYRCDCIGPADCTVAALHALRVRARDVPTEDDYDDGMPERLLRARVAIALRAALRADEDARCEGAYFAAHTLAVEDHEPLRRFARPRMWGVFDAIDALREWSQVRLSPRGRVPLALWERTR